MARLDANLDACRLSNELLTRLRKIVREALRANFGASWEESGIPGDIREFLIQRQAREASINWNLSDSCDALDFAGYLNLSDIIVATPGLFERFQALAPDADVVRMRFLELDTILNRIAYVRPISEADLGLLATFDDRMKKIFAGPPPAAEEPAAAAGQPAPKPRPAPQQPARAAAPPRPPEPADGAPTPKRGPGSKTPPRSVRRTSRPPSNRARPRSSSPPFTRRSPRSQTASGTAR
jgi:hypothetical protein